MSVLEIPARSSARSSLQFYLGPNSRRRAADRGIVHAKSQDGLLTWSYTNRLFSRHGHAEVLVVGLDPFLANVLLVQVLEEAGSGKYYSPAHTADFLAPKITCAFREVHAAAAERLMPGLGVRPSLQLVYPDHKNCLPWATGYNRSWERVQPLFMAELPLSRTASDFLEAALHRPLQEDRRAGDRSAAR